MVYNLCIGLTAKMRGENVGAGSGLSQSVTAILKFSFDNFYFVGESTDLIAIVPDIVDEIRP
jgi:hypothetical protein